MAIVAEVSNNDITNRNFPITSHANPWNQTALLAAEQIHHVPHGGRLTRALGLVLNNAVTLKADGTALVRRGTHTYTITQSDGCTCEDARRRTIWCKHKLAVEIHMRATALLQESEHANNLQPHTDTSELVAQGSTAWRNHQSPTLMSAQSFSPSTCCIKAVVGTREISWTIWGDDNEVSTRVQRVLRFLDALQGRAEP